MPQRVCFALDLVDDAELIAAYERAHAPGAAWPEVMQGIRAKGFLEMEIWRVADRLFMVATVADDFPRMISAAEREIDARWESEMDRFQVPLQSSDRGQKWAPMKRIFSLSEQSDQSNES